FAVLMLSMRLACLTLWPSRWLIVASAVLLAENPISWDLRHHNVNLIYLGLVVACKSQQLDRRRSAGA
ncbi:MAG: hypothetical protein ABWZ64_13235, partial [Xanthobacteraceae bacterium]